MRFFSTGVSVLSLTLLFMFIGYLLLVYPEVRQEDLMSEDGIIIIKITPNGFQPVSATVLKGSSVRWVNQDYAKHRVTGVDFISDVLSHGQSYSFKFTETGIYEYADEFNPGLKGRIVVE